MPRTDQLTAHLDRLAAFDGGPFPVLSLYLNAQPNQHGRDHFDTFLRVELADRLRTYPAEAPERQSLEQDHARIAEYLQTIDRSANGIAIFACSAARLFEAIQLAAPVTENRLFISPEPHLYPLARLADDYPRYAVLVPLSVGSAMFLRCASDFNSSLALPWSVTMRWANCFTSWLWAFAVASLPSSTSAMPPMAASITNWCAGLAWLEPACWLPGCWAMAGAAPSASTAVPQMMTFFM